MCYRGRLELRYSRAGHPFHVWKREMRKIDDIILDCVIYLYPTMKDADAGVGAGGTGFLVGIPSEQHPPIAHLYAVSNSHVVHDRFPTDAKSPVIRLNIQKGEHDSYELEPDD